MVATRLATLFHKHSSLTFSFRVPIQQHNKHPVADPITFHLLPAVMKLNEKSVKALENLKNYPRQVDGFLASKRSAVLVALLANSEGDLEVILTVRSSSLRTNAGDSAFPGGMYK